MIRVLFIIAAAGIVLAAVCFGGAFALGGRDIAENGWTIPANWEFDSDRREFRAVDAGPTTTRTLEWAGAESLEIHLAADVEFTQAETPSMVITGPAELVRQIAVEGGRIDFDDRGDRGFSGVRFRDAPRVRIVVAGPEVRRFELHGSQDLTVNDYDQDTFTLAIHGSGDVVARGRAQTVDLEIHGSGDADLSGLTSESAEVMIAGSGEAEVAPTGRADISIHGSGDVTLASRPAQVSRNIHGSGDIHQR